MASLPASQPSVGREKQPGVTPRGLGAALVDVEGVPGLGGTDHQMEKWSLHGRWPHREGPRSRVGNLEKQTQARGGTDRVSPHLRAASGRTGIKPVLGTSVPSPEMCPPRRVLVRLTGHHLRKVLAFSEWLLHASSQRGKFVTYLQV